MSCRRKSGEPSVVPPGCSVLPTYLFRRRLLLASATWLTGTSRRQPYPTPPSSRLSFSSFRASVAGVVSAWPGSILGSSLMESRTLSATFFASGLSGMPERTRQNGGILFHCLRAGHCGTGAPGGTRTPGLLVRSQSLYPAELRARIEGIAIQWYQMGQPIEICNYKRTKNEPI